METQSRNNNQIFSEQAKESAAQQSSEPMGLHSHYPVPLPSCGLVYPEGHKLHNQDTIAIRPMTAREDNILMSRESIRKGTVVDELLRACVVDKTINMNSLLTGDRNAIMVAIRIYGIGEDYSVKVECPACSEKSDFTFDLSQLESKDFNPQLSQQVVPFTNLFSYVLPLSQKVVNFKLLTGDDERKILDLMEQKKKKGLPDEIVTTRLLFSIVSIDGKDDRALISSFVNTMPARDARALRKHMDQIDPSIDMSQNFVCKNCAHEEVMNIPMGVEFLWPKQ